MPLPSGRSRRRALTASASRLGDRESEYQKRQGLPWQTRALAYIDIVPELSFTSRFYSRMLRQVRLFPALRGEDEHLTAITEGPPVELLDRIQDPGGGRAGILGAFGRLMFVTGEGVLFGRNLDSEQERWSFVWNDEVDIDRASDGTVRKITHKTGPSEKHEYGPEEARVYRMWTPHPRFSAEADSPMRSTLDIAEELVLLTYGVRATTVTRLTSGLMLIPDEVSFASPEPEGDEDPLNDIFLADWADHLSTQVENPGSAEARVPFTIRVASDMIERFRHLKIHDPTNDYMERDLRKEAIDRLAFGLDLSPEELRGLGQANHWVARSIMADRWPSHGAPIGQQFATDLNEVYLRPALKEVEYENWERVVIGIDASRIEILTDPSDDADRSLDRISISRKAYRKMKNIPEEYAPDEEEERFLLALRLRNPQLLGGEAPTTQGSRPAEEGPPLPGPEGDSGRRTRVTAAAAMEVGAALTALARCRELAGTRLRQKAVRSSLEHVCPECETQPLGLTAAVLGPQRLEQVRMDGGGRTLNPGVLVRGGSDQLRTVLLAYGWSQKGAESLCRLIERHAADTLFGEDLPPLPDDFDEHLLRLREVV